MYGIVNKAMEELVISEFGTESWEAILKKSGVEVDFFISNEPYDDAITYKLAIAASEVLAIPVSTVLEVFGRWWIIHTGKEKYGGLMSAGGKNLKEFLINLPSFHTRIMLIYPKLTPPEFQVTDITDHSIMVHYYSEREGLKDFVKGLLLGLAEMYQIEVEIELVKDRDLGDDHEVFSVKW